jgi:dipeptidyl aminopeptidase/acylaminoacyl peptidase
MKIVWAVVLVSMFVFILSRSTNAQQTKKPFTVADDIAFTHFVPSGYSAAYRGFNGQSGIVFSPNGELFAVLSEHGNPGTNQVDESLSFYRRLDVENFLKTASGLQPPAPVWVITRSATEEPIANFRWLADSSGVALQEFLEGSWESRLLLADLRKKTTETLPGQVAQLGSFDISSRNRYIYVAGDDAARKEALEKREAERRAPMVALNGDIAEILLPDDLGFLSRRWADKKHLWLADGGKRFEINHDGTPISVSDIETQTPALSPDGQFLVTKQRVKNIPQSWEQLYPPPYPSSTDRLHAGESAMQYVLIDLKTGSAVPLTDAPVSSDAGWGAGDGSPVWSSDGRAILLPGTFIKSKDNAPSRPCMAVLDLSTNTASCVEKLKGHINEREFEKDYRHFTSARFVGGDKSTVELAFFDLDEVSGTVSYRRTSNGDWQGIGQNEGHHYGGPHGIDISVREALDQPPMLIASQGNASRVLWNPNPQFKDIDLGQVKVYEWKDKQGRDWTGGLYLPAGYQAGTRYPLVIQTHGFSRSAFRPSGSFPTAFAARELAASGIAVLQIGGGRLCEDLGPDEASCEVSGFESGARQLATDGLVDLGRVGYIGFSRSCWYGAEMLTNGSLPLKAAVLADGITLDYLQFILYGVDFQREIGVKPFGEGLQTWLKRSPGFHLDNVTAPVLIPVEAKGAITMWQLYNGLRYLKKPVEMIAMNTDEHVITNPRERMASQGLSVDWFRFWLKDEEDPDPAKADQYKRWRGLRNMQAENEKKSAAPQAASN